jgi:DNA repair exonuclease SbcCD ATPase subunit
MYIEFEKLIFRNILSYGNNETEIDFKPGINIIFAKNGSGKSSILDALFFALYGKPYRNIKLVNLVNSLNKKNMVCRVFFKKGDDHYEIIRGQKPDILSYKKNGVEVALTSTKKLIQTDLDQIIGIDSFLFKNIVAVATTYNQPFLSLSNTDRNKLVENLFNLAILRKIEKAIKGENIIAKQNLTLIMKDLENAENQLNLTNTSIANINQTILTNQNKAESLRDKEIGDLIEKNEKNTKILSEFREKSKIATSNIIDVRSKKDTLQNEINNLTVSISKIDIYLSVLDKGSCPVCGNILTDDKHIQDKDSKIEERSSLLKLLNEDQSSLRDLNKIEENNVKNEKIIADCNNIITIGEAKISDNLAKIEKLRKTKSEIDLSELLEKENSIKSKLNTDIVSFKKEITDKNKECVIIDNVFRITSEDGIRHFLFGKLINVFNNIVNKNLHNLSVKVQVKFDSNLDYVITGLRGENIEYNQFSGGERTRIDMGILLAFLNLSGDLANWNTNILFIDELFDSGIDNEGIDALLKSLNSLIMIKNQSCYLISHRLDTHNETFKSILKIEKNSGFSTISNQN